MGREPLLGLATPSKGNLGFPVRTGSWGPSPTPGSFSKVPQGGSLGDRSPGARMFLECSVPYQAWPLTNCAFSLGVGSFVFNMGVLHLVTRGLFLL